MKMNFLRTINQFRVLRGLIFLACLALALPAMAAWTQRQKITSTPRGVGAQFGNAVAINGGTMVVGARFDSTTASQAGAAYVFVLNNGTWTQQAVLLAPDGAALDKFGSSVAISEDTIVVGAYQDDTGFADGGSAYVFVRSGTSWSEQQILQAQNGSPNGAFGVSVSVSGDTALIGARNEVVSQTTGEVGAAYVFTRTGATWTQTLTKIFIPVALPGIIAATIFCFTVAWAQFLYPLAFTTSTSELVLPVGIVTTLIKGDVFNWGQIMTGALLGAAPPLIIYAFLMDYYIAGLTAGAVKG